MTNDEKNVIDEHIKDTIESSSWSEKINSAFPDFLTAHRKFMATKSTTDTGNKWVGRFFWAISLYLAYTFLNLSLLQVIIVLLALHLLEFSLWAKLGEPQDAMRKVMS